MVKEKLPIVYFFVLLLICSVIVISNYLNLPSFRVPNEYKIEKGVLNLKDYNFSKHRVLPIAGNCEFYWGKLIDETSNNITPDAYLDIPGSWTKQKENKYPSQGYASYRFLITHLNDSVYTLKIKQILTAYNIVVNGHKHSFGKVAVNKDNYTPFCGTQLIDVIPSDGEIEVIVQIANYNHRNAGIDDNMYFGYKNDIVKKHNKTFLGIVFVLGIFLIMFLHHLGIFIYRSHHNAILYFAIICLLSGLRLMLTDDKAIFGWLPNINWLLATKVEYLTATLYGPVFYLFYQKVFPGMIHEKIFKVYVSIGLALSAVVLLFPSNIFTYVPLFLHPITALASLHILWLTRRTILKYSQSAIIFYIGFYVLMIFVINEFLYYYDVLETGLIMHYGVVIFMFTQAFVLSGWFSRAYLRIEELSYDLEEHNRELEEVVKERTTEIEAQKSQIEEQANELSISLEKLKELDDFKVSMTNMVVHDMKAHLSPLLNIPDNPDEDMLLLVRQSGQQLHTLVMNMLELQKFETAKIQVYCEEFDMAQLAQNSFLKIHYLAKLKNINCINNLDIGIRLNADEYLFERVMVNLFYNAIKFSPENTKIIVSSQEDEEGWIRIDITDFGKGVPKELHTKIFEPYSQIYDKNSKKYSTGLGLAFCKCAVEAHGGHIGVDSKVGFGSTFWFTAPLKEAEGE